MYRLISKYFLYPAKINPLKSSLVINAGQAIIVHSSPLNMSTGTQITLFQRSGQTQKGEKHFLPTRQ